MGKTEIQWTDATWNPVVGCTKVSPGCANCYAETMANRLKAMAMADIAAAAQISCVDYVGDVPWEDFPEAKTWYARVKSRPSLRPILADHIPGIPPPKHYANPDF